MKPQPPPAYPGSCPHCGSPLRTPDNPLPLLHVDLDRPVDDPHRVVHAACTPRRRST